MSKKSRCRPSIFNGSAFECSPEHGNYFTTINDYLKEVAGVNHHDKYNEINDRLSDLTRRPWAASDQPEIAGWLKKNERPLELLIEATHRPQYFNPLVPDNEKRLDLLIGALLPSVQQCRLVAHALCCLGNA